MSLVGTAHPTLLTENTHTVRAIKGNIAYCISCLALIIELFSNQHPPDYRFFQAILYDPLRAFWREACQTFHVLHH